MRNIGVVPTGDGGDGALVTVDLDTGVRLASLPHDHRDLASLDTLGIRAAVEATTNLTVEANALLGRQLRTTTGAGGPSTGVTDR